MAAHRRKLGLDVIQGGRTHESSDPFSLSDYIQMAGLGNHSVTVVISGADLRGEIIIQRGEAWAAHDERGAGEDAFRRLVGGTLDRPVPVKCRPLGIGVVPRNIHCSLESMMLDSARRWDERARSADLPPQAPKVLPSGSDHFEAFFDEALDALLRKDFKEALAAFTVAHDIRPDDQVVVANLERLQVLGTKSEG